MYDFLLNPLFWEMMATAIPRSLGQQASDIWMMYVLLPLGAL